MAGQFDPGVETGFQRLSLDIPVPVDQFHKVYNCIERVFSAVDPSELNKLSSSSGNNSHNNQNGINNGSPYIPIIGSNIMFPRDAWYRPEVAVKNAKVKVTLLADIIRVVESELHEGQTHENEVSLAYFEKLLVAFKVYEVPERSSFYGGSGVSLSTSTSLLFNNNNTNNNYNNFETASKTSSFGGWRSQSNGQSSSNYSFNEKDEDKLNESLAGSIHHVLLPEHHGKRSSVFSKEILAGKRRFLSFLLSNNGQNNSTTNNSNTNNNNVNHSIPNNNSMSNLNGSNNSSISTHSSDNVDEEEETKRQQALSNLLSKTKLYSKVKKNRDSTGSQLSGGQRSNRNSASSATLHKVRNSQTSLMLVESVSLERSGSNSGMGNPNQCVIPLLTQAQKLEVQKTKSEYLGETRRLVQLAGTMASSLDRANKYSRLIQFIMKFVFKFIMYDIHQMLLDYCQVREAEVVKKC